MKGSGASLGYGVLDQVAARVFDLATLWVVMRALPEADLAKYGIATALLFIFNLVLVVPENALMRDRRRWKDEGTLPHYIEGFLLFAALRIACMVAITIIAAVVAGTQSPYFLVTLFALGSQLIQLAELSRLDLRIDLQQKRVFRAELVFKLLLLMFVLVLFRYPALVTYLVVYLAWGTLVAAYWSGSLLGRYGIGIRIPFTRLQLVWQALREFSFWQHLSGVVTYVIYNIDPWVLTWFAVALGSVSTYTVALKIAALFFTVPMFLQSMITIFLHNTTDELEKHRIFRRMFALNAAVAVVQLLLFVAAGPLLGRLFRGNDLDAPLFQQLGIVLCLGVFVLNLARPLLSDLLLHARMPDLLMKVYLPTLLVALSCYVALTAGFGALGCAVASFVAYATFAMLLINQSRFFGIARAALIGTNGWGR